MMTYTTMWAYPWDLLDDGADDVVRRLRDEIGLDAISLATSYHSVEHLRPHTRGQRMFIAHDAGLYFQPDAALWRDVTLRPNIAPLAESRDPLRAVCEAAERAGLKVESWTVCLHNSYLGRHYPDAVERNVFGDPYTPHLCPSNPDVRAYITTLVRDLATNFSLFAVELESLHFGGFGHFHGHEKIGLELGHVGNFLMSLCFCECCRQRARTANIDIDELAARVRQHLEGLFERGAPLLAHVDDLATEDEALRAFLDLRKGIVSSLTREVKEAAGDRFLVSMAMGDSRVSGYDAKTIGEIADALELLCYTAQPDVVERAISQATTQFCNADDLIVGLSAFAPHSPSGNVLVRNVQRALQMGVRGFSFYNYGIMPERNLEWVRSAVKTIRDADGS